MKCITVAPRYGRLTVLRELEQQEYLRVLWCRCDCGTEKAVKLKNVRSGTTSSCGCFNKQRSSETHRGKVFQRSRRWQFVPKPGMRFDRLLVTAVIDNPKPIGSLRPRLAVEVQCDCGTVKVCNWFNVRSGITRSCGCLAAELTSTRRKYETEEPNFRHGFRQAGRKPTPEYSAWVGMQDRCNNPKCTGYRHYGGRGISVCQEWQDSFLAFLEHVGPRPSPKHSIDRYPDNNGNYEPGNVRWATWSQQMRNRRPRSEWGNK